MKTKKKTQNHKIVFMKTDQTSRKMKNMKNNEEHSNSNLAIWTSNQTKPDFKQ